MSEIIFKMPSYSMDGDNNVFEILTMKRGQRRRMAYHLIIVEALRALSGKPTRDELQKFSKIRRKRFIQVLKHLLETESVKRFGTGTKFDPHRFGLGEKEIRR